VRARVSVWSESPVQKQRRKRMCTSEESGYINLATTNSRAIAICRRERERGRKHGDEQIRRFLDEQNEPTCGRPLNSYLDRERARPKGGRAGASSFKRRGSTTDRPNTSSTTEQRWSRETTKPARAARREHGRPHSLHEQHPTALTTRPADNAPSGGRAQPARIAKSRPEHDRPQNLHEQHRTTGEHDRPHNLDEQHQPTGEHDRPPEHHG